MCSEYQIKTTPKDIEKALGTIVVNSSEQKSWDETVKMSRSAPIIQLEQEKLILKEKIFPVSPFPNARLSGIGNQTDAGDTQNDDEDRQIKRIYDMPRWKKAFTSSPLLVPMTTFTEYAYWGKDAGSALSFTIPDEELFFAAGITMKAFIPKGSKEDEGFAILTHTATEEMLKHHHRLIVLLKAKEALGYLEDMEPAERFEYLIKNRYTGHLESEKIRTMAKGWEKRAPVQMSKLSREENYRDTLKKEHVQG